MPDIYVCWCDDYGNSHNSPVYSVDPINNCFLVIDEYKDFHWVSISACELLQMRGQNNWYD